MRLQWPVWTPSVRLRVCPLSLLYSCSAGYKVSNGPELYASTGIPFYKTAAGAASGKAFLPMCQPAI